MRVLVTGGNGQLGKALQNIYPEGIFTDSHDLDITDQAALAAFDWNGIEAIINAAAFTAVDKAELPEMIPLAWGVNALGPANLAAIAKARNIPLVHVSSDYVYDGQNQEHTEDEALRPLSSYGASKAAGDLAAAQAPQHYIVRSSWVVGDGPNFVRTMLTLGKDRSELTVVNDQIGRLTFADDLAGCVQHLLDKKAASGIYHFSNEGQPSSWADITRAIFEIAGYEVMVNETSTEEYARGKSPWALRPSHSTLNLDKIKATGLNPRDWQEALKDYVEKELGK